jgi:sarcosine oxidase/L-pipecolate oxidase
MAYTRMCWYSDTPDSDFVIDFSPYKSMLIASGGAGHGFKFLPVLGECIHARLENRLPPHLTHKWRIHRPLPEFCSDRHGMRRQPLVLDHLVTGRDLDALNGSAREAKL